MKPLRKIKTLLTDANDEAPSFAATGTATISENSGAGQLVYTPIAATPDVSGDTVTYELGGTDAGLAECVGEYDQINQLLMFSFPTFTNSEFPNGFIMVFDLAADAMGISSTWVMFDNGTSFKTACLATDNHLISFSGTKGYDWNGTPDELVATAIETHPLRNRLHGKELYIKKVYVESEGLTPTLKTYIDESSSVSDTLSFASKGWQWIKRVCERFTLRIETSASLSPYTLRGAQIDYTEKGAE